MIPENDLKTRLKDEMRLSPRLNQHASGVVLGVTQIINGLYNPVSVIIQNPALIVTLEYLHDCQFSNKLVISIDAIAFWNNHSLTHWLGYVAIASKKTIIEVYM